MAKKDKTPIPYFNFIALIFTFRNYSFMKQFLIFTATEKKINKNKIEDENKKRSLVVQKIFFIVQYKHFFNFRRFFIFEDFLSKNSKVKKNKKPR